MKIIINKTKKNHGVFGSLAIRILSISFILIILPLIFYSIFIYEHYYDKQLQDIFDELEITQENHINFIDQLARYNLVSLDVIHQIYSEDLKNNKMENILNKFANANWAASFFYLAVQKNGNLLCEYTSLPSYKKINFTPYFKSRYLQNNMFVGDDPIFKYSLFDTKNIIDKNGELTAILVSATPLNKLINILFTLRSTLKTNISIVDKDNKILESSDINLIGEKLTKLVLKKIKQTQNGFAFTFDNKKRFAIITPLLNTQTYIMLSVPSEILIVKIYQYIIYLAYFLIFIIIIGGTASCILTWRISRPLRNLDSIMTKVGEGDLSQRFIYDYMGFEINFLGEKFNEMILSLIDHIEIAKKEKVAKEIHLKELQIGHAIQKSILLTELPNFPSLELDVFFQGAKEVAGDYYDWLLLGDKILLVIADGVGKGISGCLYSLDLRSILRSFATVEQDIKKIVQQTNKLFCADTKDTSNFVTAFVASFDTTTNVLSSINCGHNYPIIKDSSGAIKRISTRGIAFGVDECATYSIEKNQLQSGDIIIFYTDGITDTQDINNNFFTENRLENAIRSSSATSAKEMLESIKMSVKTFAEGAEQYDDMTLLVVKIK